MKFFLDAEFNGFGGDLISIALVSNAGHEWYEVTHCDAPIPWVRQHVMPVLQRPAISRDEVTASLRRFLVQFDEVHIVADWPEDIIHLCSLLIPAKGHRIATPPMTLELITLEARLESTTAHNALSDARALRDMLLWRP